MSNTLLYSTQEWEMFLGKYVYRDATNKREIQGSLHILINRVEPPDSLPLNDMFCVHASCKRCLFFFKFSPTIPVLVLVPFLRVDVSVVNIYNIREKE